MLRLFLSIHASRQCTQCSMQTSRSKGDLLWYPYITEELDVASFTIPCVVQEHGVRSNLIHSDIQTDMANGPYTTSNQSVFPFGLLFNKWSLILHPQCSLTCLWSWMLQLFLSIHKYDKQFNYHLQSRVALLWSPYIAAELILACFVIHS